MNDTTVFKILTAEQWAGFQADGKFIGGPVDLIDGYIHLSTAAQLDKTMATHFANQPGLVVAEIDLASLGDTIQWELSRGGANFPHYYSALPMSAVLSVRTTPDAINTCPAK